VEKKMEYCEKCNKKLVHNTIKAGYNTCSDCREYFCVKCGKRISYSSFKRHRLCRSCGRRGIKFSDEAKKNISKARKKLFSEGKIIHPRGMLGKRHSIEAKTKIGESSSKRKHTEETKRKISDGNKGKKMSDKARQKMSENHADVSGSKNPMYGRPRSQSEKERQSNKMKELHKKGIYPDISGDRNPMFGKSVFGNLSDEEKKILYSEIGKKSSITMKRNKTFVGDRNPMFGKNVLDIWIKKFGKERALEMWSNKFNSMRIPSYDHGWYQSIKTNEENYFQSSYEKIRMNELDRNEDVLYWTKRHGILIEYFLDNKKYHYVPDFLIEYNNGDIFMEEVKGYIKEPNVFNAKCKAATIFCEVNGMQFRVNYMKHLLNWEKNQNEIYCNT